MFKAYFFDLDGTLADTLADLAAAANAVRRAFGLAELPLERVRGYIGNGIRILIHRVLSDDPDGRVSDEELERGYEVFIDHYGEHLCVATRLYPGVADTLAQLHQRGAKLAVITNKNEALAMLLLADLGIDPYFAVVYGGDTFPRKKPDPLPLAMALEALKLSPAEVLMVGDSANDLGAARAAGLKVAYYKPGFGGAALASQADYALDDFSQLLALD